MDFDKVSPKSMEFLSKVAERPEEFDILATSLISEMEAKNLVVPDFSASFEWLNTSDGLSFKGNLANKICVMDFFTYCCINCMHVLPDLHALEEKFSIEDGVAVIGVHSAKFQNEKLLTNILSAVMRYNICHPVVNDCDAVMWNAMSIRCWPTFVIVSPAGKVLLYLVGEGHRDVLLKFVAVALDFYRKKGLIQNHKLPIRLAKDSMTSTQFKFPGKLAISNTDGRIAVADTGNHQIVVLDKDGVICQKIGSGLSGHVDGSFSSSSFFAPQGLTWHDNVIFVADTENHVVRKINLDANDVTTVIGTGKQGNDKEGGKKSTEQEISSPWDVLIAPAPGSDVSNKDNICILIAMAGTHQIWCYYLQDGGWLKKGSKEKETCLRFAGSGNEENRNNSYPHKAAFAQPSGLTMGITKEKYFLYVADSESSSIRSVEISNGAVKACVGAERDPMNLFAYGDVDGKGVDAKLQHPLAVEYNSENGFVYVADSYNHKIKVIDPVKLTCSTLAGTGNSGLTNGKFSEVTFNEPGDLKFSPDKKLLFVADTNNHLIRVLNMEKETVETLVTLDSSCVDNVKITEVETIPNNTETKYKPLVGKNAELSIMGSVKRDLQKGITIDVRVEISDELKFTEDVESKYQIVLNVEGSQDPLKFSSGIVPKNTPCCMNIITPLISSDLEVNIELLLFVCTNNNMCLMKQFKIQQKIFHSKDGAEDNVLVIHRVGSSE